MVWIIRRPLHQLSEWTLSASLWLWFAKRDLVCWQFDINNAFTESRLKEDIYLAPPAGVTVTKGKVLKALRSLYGLKQAGRDWNLLLKQFLITRDLSRAWQTLAYMCMQISVSGCLCTLTISSQPLRRSLAYNCFTRSFLDGLMLRTWGD